MIRTLAQHLAPLIAAARALTIHLTVKATIRVGLFLLTFKEI